MLDQHRETIIRVIRSGSIHTVIERLGMTGEIHIG
jgi:hypothetical protein